ncbi:MAG: hypothetical protein PF693_11335 [Spirochaetia bacterium]|nr:hypothetical protein [Spirochaetia bacterium]
MAVTQKDLSQISDYIKGQFLEWIESIPLRPVPSAYGFELHERMIRVEEELKNQRELMKQGFEQVDKRFEQVDKRFEQMENHFSELSRRMFHFMIWSFGSTATAAGIIITVLKI